MLCSINFGALSVVGDFESSDGCKVAPIGWSLGAVTGTLFEETPAGLAIGVDSGTTDSVFTFTSDTTFFSKQDRFVVAMRLYAINGNYAGNCRLWQNSTVLYNEGLYTHWAQYNGPYSISQYNKATFGAWYNDDNMGDSVTWTNRPLTIIFSVDINKEMHESGDSCEVWICDGVFEGRQDEHETTPGGTVHWESVDRTAGAHAWSNASSGIMKPATPASGQSYYMAGLHIWEGIAFRQTDAMQVLSDFWCMYERPRLWVPGIALASSGAIPILRRRREAA